MSKQKPKSITEYKDWLKKEQNTEITSRTEAYYSSVTQSVKLGVLNSEIWNCLQDNLREFNDEYQIKTGYPLLIGIKQPGIDIKSFNSFINKTYRKNILNNSNWPDPPNQGWILPENWYTRINDIVRTLIIVKYLDGVEFISNKIDLLCADLELYFRSFFEAREEGYYAAHLYTNIDLEIPNINWDTRIIKVSFEIQVTTQLQEVIRKLLHKYYEDRRSKKTDKDSSWQWDYKSDEFSANYLGHILHYVEGMIIDIRERQKNEEK